MKIKIYSRAAMRARIREGKLDNTAVISFYDPESGRTPKDYHRLEYGDCCDRVFYVPIHDIDLEILGEYGLTFDDYFPEVTELAQFVHSAIEDGVDIICQCEYGQSRSAACAAAIREHFFGDGIEVFADYRYYPNQLIFNKLRAALKEAEQ